MYLRTDLPNLDDPEFKLENCITGTDLQSNSIVYHKPLTDLPAHLRYTYFAKMLNDHLEAYSKELGLLTMESERAHKRQIAGPVLIQPDHAISILDRYKNSLEHAIMDEKWNMTLPYAQVIFRLDGTVDLSKSRVYIFGVMYRFQDW